MTKGIHNVYETFWGNSAPVSTDGSNLTFQTYAMRFQLTVAGSLFALRYAREKRTNGPVIGVLWDATTLAPIRSVAFREKTASGTGFDRWETKYFHPKVPVAINQQFIVAITLADSRAMFTANGLTAASITHGHITALKDGLSGHANGMQETDAVVFPSTSAGGDLTMVDLVFGVAQ